MEIITSTILSIVGTSTLLGALVWLFKTWIKTRLTEDIKHEHDRDLANLEETNNRKLEELKSNLAAANALEIEKFKAITGVKYDSIKESLLRYAENQFTLYNELWASLCDLRNCVDDLWNNATLENLGKLAEQVHDARLKVRKSALLVEDRHYAELNYALDQFEAFQFGKKTLIELRTASRTMIPPNQIESAILQNAGIREQLIMLLDSMMMCLKRQINLHYVSETNDGRAQQNVSADV